MAVTEDQEQTGAPVEAGATPEERLLAELNPPQCEAVTHGDGPLLVLAGAGSGKTRVLTHRIAWLVATGRAQPGEILAITFTNKAADEMRERVEGLVGRVSRLMWVMTFHSACARILRREAGRLGYKGTFTIYDEGDSLRMVKRCMRELDLDPKRFAPRAVRALISGAKNQLLDAEGFREQQGSFFEQTAADVYELYEKRMHEANSMDFDDLLVRTVNLLELFEDVLGRYQQAFRQVLVDEYQDTNRAQYRLLQLLCEAHRNLFVVGDESQSIYGFRHADIRNILEFERDFPDADVVKLEQNYRSTQTILDATNAVIANNRARKPKRLWTDEEGGDPIGIVELGDEHEEARYVAGEAERLATDEDVPRTEIAVFYRTNAQSRVLEDTLVRFDVPYQVIGGTKFYERAEIKDAIAYLTLLTNPADGVAFARIVNSPRRGIGQTTQARLLSHANTTGQAVWEVARRPEDVPGLGTAAVKAVSRFAETLEGLRERAAGAPPVAELLEAVLSESGYVEALEAERTIESEGRVENLRELVGVAGEFDANRALEESSADGEQLPPLDEFLQQLALYTDQDSLRDDEELVTLMTLHNAKGLEFNSVFVIGCEEGVFPHSRSVEEGNLEEERRLCYVGATRAKRRLWMTFARQRSLYGARGYNLPSRFLSEIPEGLVERQGGVEATGWLSGEGAGATPLSGALPHPAVELGVGDDVVHASFGDGVVTAVEPGSVVVVRFAADGSERKLMADYAPLRKAGVG
ncbi:MAG TPA: UvrD-helicase domain-containing protein [Solirubrobacterales bacterium]|nr:UvrD-helicase domain-containing protein [Solirubrobacterales bacterium]